MPTDAPPSYETVAHNPELNVTDPTGHTDLPRTASQSDTQHPFQRSQSNSSISTVSSSGLGADDLVGDEGRRSMDDEARELPPGWVRCFDPKTEHHFYVDESTKRATWLHPYDDPEYLRTLPDTHPANPNSVEAQAMRKRAEDEALLAKRIQESDAKGSKKAAGHGADTSAVDDGMVVQNTKAAGGDRNWLQRQKDKLVGTKEERAQAKEQRRKQREEERKRMKEAQEAYMKRRQELLKKQLNDPNIRAMYASDPYRYAAPSMAYTRSGGLYDSPYGYGYNGGYGRRYGYGYGGMGGGMGIGMPLMGGMAGGLLLGDMMSGGLGGGGFGGGFGGGGFGGGGFDGGMGGGFGGGGFDGGGGMGGGGGMC
ncbi:hypothetical protein BCR39DRAFT_588260 [Naematelia encephala]|uniref:WW domain-containing protein n=1 Tax=Naematelia encephala TaxID=71784 RepID=A0A1Y2B550_9TREE|nr:hypothetical protein BCR39DRAFT_588260 [Naematelia encephala]